MNKKHTWAIVLLAVLLFLTACGGSVTPAETEATQATAATTTATETTLPAETELPGPQIEAIDGGNTEFRVMVRSLDKTFPISELSAAAPTGEVMNDAVYERNCFIEEKYNVKLVSQDGTATEIREAMQQNIAAGDSTYDLYMPSIRNAFILTLEGKLVDVEDIPHVDIENPWWQTQMLDNFSISNTNFFLVGDMNISIFNAIGTIYLNQKVAEDNQIPNIYQTVRDGKWTIDLMHEYCLKVTHDLNGDLIIDGSDVFGFVTGNFAWQTIFYGSGEGFVLKDNDDIPYLTWDTEKNINVITKMTELLNDENATLMSNQERFKGANVKASFMENRALFRCEYVYNLYEIRDMQTDFGMLPAPKYDETQDTYYSAMHTTHSSATCVPTTNNRMELTGAILEDMAYQSYKIVRPAFYDITLTGKFARNEDTVEMLDIMYANINTDLSLAMATTGLTIDKDMRAIYTDDKSEFISAIATVKKANEITIQMNVQKFLSRLK